jgi:hypothetical protein
MSLSAEDAAYYAETLSEFQRQVLALCSSGQSIGYAGLARSLGVEYRDVQLAGNHLQAANLATVETIRRGNEYAGSAIFLNDRGEQVKLAASRLGF